jgi:hypothetical protein
MHANNAAMNFFRCVLPQNLVIINLKKLATVIGLNMKKIVRFAIINLKLLIKYKFIVQINVRLYTLRAKEKNIVPVNIAGNRFSAITLFR